MSIHRVAVLGAGVMGSGIAAQVANAGIEVILLDIVPEGSNDRNAVAAGAVAKMLKTQPAPFMDPNSARRISVGNLEDDLGKLAEADWIIEAVIERLDVKRDLYKKIDAVRKKGSTVSSNTSTIPLASLLDEMPESFRCDFLITHFFNPPRYMRLLELVAGPTTREDATSELRDFCDRALGKGVVDCKDTPGFIGNRIGVYWLQCAALEAMRQGLTVEEADAVAGRPLGIPKTGVFGLMDLVGIDLMPHIMVSMDNLLAPDDAMREYFEVPDLVKKMIANGYTGRKGKGGFYRLQRDGGKRVKQAIDLATGEYRDAGKAELASIDAARSGGVRALMEHPDKGGAYAWRIMAKTLAYAASLVPEIADDIVAVDEAMKLGYNWTRGPFELIDALGAAWFAGRLRDEGETVPALLEQVGDDGFYRIADGRRQHFGIDGAYHDIERAVGVELLADVKLRAQPLTKNGSASLWDVGDGVVCLEFHSKMNAIDTDILEMIGKALEIVPGGYEGLVIYNEGANFSVGANLGLMIFAANTAAWDDIEATVRGGQQAYKALKHAPFPVVGAPAGMALGGGCEVLLHCDAVQAHAETYMGLVEVGVGLIPGWGGCKELLLRWWQDTRRPGGPMPAISRAFETISMATVSTSAADARRLRFLRHDDGITMNRDRVLADAKSRVLALARDYDASTESPEPALPGATAKVALQMAVEGFRRLGKASDYDTVIADALADVLSGGDTDITETVDEDALLDIERRAFMSLVKRPQTLARIEHMLETGKPLRN